MSTPFDHILPHTRSADYTKPTATASRAWQVEAEIVSANIGGAHPIAALEKLARTLAAEVDELRDELARVKAESLRVVVDGDAVLLRYVIAPFAMTESRTIIKKNFGEWVSLDGAATNPSLLDTIAKPARLKPWEEE